MAFGGRCSPTMEAFRRIPYEMLPAINRSSTFSTTVGGQSNPTNGAATRACSQYELSPKGTILPAVLRDRGVCSPRHGQARDAVPRGGAQAAPAPPVRSGPLDRRPVTAERASSSRPTAPRPAFCCQKNTEGKRTGISERSRPYDPRSSLSSGAVPTNGGTSRSIPGSGSLRWPRARCPPSRCGPRGRRRPPGGSDPTPRSRRTGRRPPAPRGGA